MPNEHLILCGGARLSTRQQIWRKAKVVELRAGRRESGSDNNINLEISDLTETLTANLSALELDLLEIATYVYCADQATCRGGKKRIDYGESWYRDFRFKIPVRQPDFWSSQDVYDDLTRTLCDLSGDNFDFAFSHHAQPAERGEYFEFGDEDISGVEEVLLFSGGLDSFAGAVEEILGLQRKVALVSHRTNPKIDSRQKQLVAALAERVPDRHLQPIHVPVLINKADKILNKEYTQRTRSFLYMSLAAIVARLFGLNRIRFYENGVTSLNLPISPQVVSTRATRSTHPKPLAGACSLLSRVYPDGFGIENRYFWKTKTDILKDVKEAGHSSLCVTTVSCAHTWEMRKERPHCGKCSQCVERRLATLASGYGEQEDPQDQYRFNLFTDRLDKPLDRVLLESYVEVINRIQRCDSAVRFCVEFPEVSRVLNYVPNSADDTAQAIYNLYRRHADQIGEALDAQGRLHFPSLRRGELPTNCLVSIMGAGLRRAEIAKQPEQPEPLTERPSRTDGLIVDEETFSVTWQGKNLVIGNKKEFWLLKALNSAPDQYHGYANLAESLGGDALDNITPVKSRLVKLLRENGLSDLASHIKSEKGHYGLFLSGANEM